jgi:hypothetical protein
MEEARESLRAPHAMMPQEAPEATRQGSMPTIPRCSHDTLTMKLPRTAAQMQLPFCVRQKQCVAATPMTHFYKNSNHIPGSYLEN